MVKDRQKWNMENNGTHGQKQRTMERNGDASDEPSSSLGLYFRIFAHFTSHVTLSVTVSSSQTPQCTAEAILLIAACHLGCLLLFRFFASFRFLSCIFSCHMRRHTWSDMPHTLFAHLGSSRLYFWLLSVIFSHTHFFIFCILQLFILALQLFPRTICKTLVHAQSASHHISARLGQLPVPTWFKYHKSRYKITPLLCQPFRNSISQLSPFSPDIFTFLLLSSMFYLPPFTVSFVLLLFLILLCTSHLFTIKTSCNLM